MKNILIKTLLCLAFISVVSCADEDPLINENSDIERLDAYSEDVISYFKEIALGFEYGSASKVTRKWKREMKVYVDGNPSEELIVELNQIIKEITALVGENLKISIVDDKKQSNYIVYFGKGEDYVKFYDIDKSLVEGNWGLFSLEHNANEIISGVMYVDTYRAKSKGQRHLLREELTQSLGLARDSDLYEDSMFQSRWTTVVSYSEMDKELIRLLYHPDMKTGLSKIQVDRVLRNIMTKNE